MRTSFQSTSSSSAISIGSVTFTPWPISGFFAMIVAMPLLSIETNAFGWSGAWLPRPCAKASSGSK
jgi:hypothetical protein